MSGVREHYLEVSDHDDPPEVRLVLRGVRRPVRTYRANPFASRRVIRRGSAHLGHLEALRAMACSVLYRNSP